MAGTRLDAAIDQMFDDHPSLSVSLESFDQHDPPSDPQRSPVLGISALHQSGFKSDGYDSSSNMQDSENVDPWSPSWQQPRNRHNTGGWLHHQPYNRQLNRYSNPGSAHGNGSPLKRSRESSPEYDSAPEGDITLPANTNNVRESSPLRESRSPSPAVFPEGTKDFGKTFGEEKSAAVVKSDAPAPVVEIQENPNNYIRFAVRAEVQHRTEPFEAAFAYFRQKFDLITSSRTSTICSTIIALLGIIILRLLFQSPPSQPAPDLVKVAGLARSFEPLIFYSENGVQQIGELQDTGVAVWDLGESVRSTNMTSAPLIVKELDELSESLKMLAIELTKFFASVDGDVDGILIVMEWAKRELSQVSSMPLHSLTSVFDNLHLVLSRVGLFETAAGTPTSFGKIITDLFGQSRPQRARSTLQRTFNEFLSVLEESINSELTYSTSLFHLFETIDRQFLNLARTVIRESDQQEREEGELLSSLWTRVLGPNAAQLRKYEKNKVLLLNVRDRTVRNKHLLVEHNGKLLSLKANLETLRKKLISPLVRSNDSSTLSVEEQIRGLDGTYEHLKSVRERQKGKLMEMLYGAGTRRNSIGSVGGFAIDDGRIGGR